MNVFVFDIETVPDVASGRRLYGLETLDDEGVAKALFHLRRQETGGSEFLRLHLHRVVAISAVLRSGDRVKVWSLGEESSSEKELLERFFDGLDKFVPTLVSWNGSGFDLPVLHYRALLHGVAAPRYWDTGDDDRDFRWNNYLSRYHSRHTDLMDVLAGYQARANAPPGRDRHHAGLSRENGHERRQGVGQLPVRRHCRHPQLLRNRCAQHVLGLPALSTHAWPIDDRGL
jgi:predicted PolB exonuclease-like 3'-5' exonuclease